MPKNINIIGAGQAGLQVALSLRDKGCTDNLTLFAGEPHQPYQRPPLSKGYLLGTQTEQSLYYKRPETLDALNINVCFERVESVDLTQKKLTTSVKNYEWSQLVFAVGGQARKPALPGIDLDGVFGLRSLADAQAIREQSEKATEVVVIGGGFIGLEVAATLNKLGKKVTVIELAERLLERVVCPKMSDFFYDLHQKHGTQIKLNCGISTLEGTEAVESVVLSDGTRMPAQMVVYGIGLMVDEAWLKGLGLACQGGILVDEYGRTNHAHVFASGDCTVQPHYRDQTQKIRIESVQNAIDQSKKVASAIMGQSVENTSVVPWFWSDQYDVKWQMAGWPDAYDQRIVRGDENQKFSYFYYLGHQLQTVISINKPADHLVARKLLVEREPALTFAQVSNEDHPLKNGLKAG